MPARRKSLLMPPLVLATGGASAHADPHSLDAFDLAATLGATGLETAAWLTADGVAVVHGSGTVGRIRRRPVGSMASADLVDEAVTLETLLTITAASGMELVLHVADARTAGGVVDAVRAEAAAGLVERTWLAHPDLAALASWRSRWPDVRLVHPTRIGALRDGPERHAAELYELGVEAASFPATDWTGGLTTLYHRFDRYCLATSAELERVAGEMFDAGLDAVSGSHVDRLVAAHRRVLSD